MAEKRIEGDEIIQPGVFDRFIKDSLDAKTALEAMHKSFSDFLNLSKEQSKQFSGGSSLPKQWDEQAEALHRVKEAASINVNIKKELVTIDEKIKAASSAVAVELQEQRIALAELNKENKNAATLNKAAEGSLEQLRAKLSAATKEYDKLSAAVRNSNDGMKKLEAIKNYTKELNEVEQASGRFQRNVGNYKSGYDGLAASINQLTREAPSAAVSMNTFFLAISNNLPMLVDQINQIKKANVELAASGQPTVSVFGKIASAFLSWQTLISVGITLLTVYGGKIVDFVTGTEKAEKSTFDWNKELEKSNTLLNQLNNRAFDASLRLKVALGNISKEQADAIKSERGYLQERIKINTDFDLQLSEARKRAGITKSEAEEAKTEIDVFGHIAYDPKGKKQAYLDQEKAFETRRAKALLDLDTAYRAEQDAAFFEAENKKEADRKKKQKKHKEEKHQEVYDDNELRKSMYAQELQNAKDQETALSTQNELAYINKTISKEEYEKNILAIEKDYLNQRYLLAVKYLEDTTEIEKEISAVKLKELTDAQKAGQAAVDKISEGRAAEGEKKEKEDAAKAAAAKKARIEQEKSLFDNLKKLSDDYYKDAERKIDRDLQAHKDREAELRALAQMGVDNAAESIAYEQKAQAEAEVQRQKLEKQKQRTELALATIKTLTANLEANPGDPAKAFGQTFAEIGALVAFVNGLPSFFEGTENTGTIAGGGIDGKGGRLSVLHDNEAVLTKEQNIARGDLPLDDLVKVGALYNSGLLMPVNALMPSYSSASSNDIGHKLDKVVQAIEKIDIPKQDVYYDPITKALVNQITTSRKVERNHYKPNAGIWRN